MRVIVIGAGILGAATAYYLTRSGAEVTLLDARQPAAGATGVTSAWLNAFRKVPEHYHQLNAEGMREHTRLASELGLGNLLHMDGSLHWADTAEDSEILVSHADRLTAWGYECTYLSAKQVRVLEPHITLRSEDVLLRVPSEGWVEAVPLVNSLVLAAKALGAHTVFPAKVKSITHSRGEVCVQTEEGGAFRGDNIVVAAGPWTSDVMQQLGLRIEVKLDPGVIAYTRMSDWTLRHVVVTTRIHFRPEPRELVLFGSHARSESPIVDDASAEAAVEAVLAEARKLLPSTALGGTIESRIGVRPIPMDGLPAIGWCEHVPSTFLVVTHSGMTLGPLLGRLAAEEILNNQTNDLIKPDYRPSRIVSPI